MNQQCDQVSPALLLLLICSSQAAISFYYGDKCYCTSPRSLHEVSEQIMWINTLRDRVLILKLYFKPYFSQATHV